MKIIRKYESKVEVGELKGGDVFLYSGGLCMVIEPGIYGQVLTQKSERANTVYFVQFDHSFRLNGLDPYAFVEHFPRAELTV